MLVETPNYRLFETSTMAEGDAAQEKIKGGKLTAIVIVTFIGQKFPSLYRVYQDGRFVNTTSFEYAAIRLLNKKGEDQDG